MNLAVLVIMTALGAPGGGGEQSPEEDFGRTSSETRRGSPSGLYGWGIGVEFPLVGFIGGVASRSSVGGGYTIGVAGSLELTRSFALRVHGTFAETQQGRAIVGYDESGQRLEEGQPARWYDFTLAGGITWTFREIYPGLSPYLGGDVGAALVHGFEYRFDPELENMLDDKNQKVQFDNGRLVGRDIALTADLRAGLRLELTPWLSSLVELSVAYVRNGADTINNTLTGPDVRAIEEDVWLIRTTFAVRFGL